MREMAYHYSEGRMLRWLTLMAADRVNMIEDIVNDLAHGRIPNIPKEMGLRTELRYNPRGLAKKVAITGLAVVLVAAYLRSHRR